MKHPRSIDVLTVGILYGVGTLLYILYQHPPRLGRAVPPLTVAELRGLSAEMRDITPESAGEGATVQNSSTLKQCARDWQRREHYKQKSSRTKLKTRGAVFLARLTGWSGLVTDPGQPFPHIASLAGTIGQAYLDTGDYAGARDFIRQAIRLQQDPVARNYLCGELAWLEDDPALAKRLLDQSLAGGPGPKDTGRWAFSNALELALVTDNDRLAREYWDRFPEGREYLELRGGFKLRWFARLQLRSVVQQSVTEQHAENLKPQSGAPSQGQDGHTEVAQGNVGGTAAEPDRGGITRHRYESGQFPGSFAECIVGEGAVTDTGDYIVAARAE